MDTMVDVSLGRRYKPLQPVRTELKIPHACRIFVEGIVAEALVMAASDRPVDGRVIDWDSIWHAGDGASSTEQALGRIVTAARAAADQLARGVPDPDEARDLTFPLPPPTRPERLPPEATLPVPMQPQLHQVQVPDVASVATAYREYEQPLRVSPTDVLPSEAPKMWLSAAPSGWWTAFTWIRNLGLVIGLFVAWQLWGTGIAQHHEQHQLQSAFEASVQKHHHTDATSTGPALIPASQVVPVPPEGSPVAKLQIPAIGLDEIVVSGTAESDLAEGPGHYVGTAAPGQAGNVAIAGHRTTNGAPFNRLGQLAIGDKIFLTTLAGERLTYVVSQTPPPVPPSDVTVLDDFSDNRITLTTCNPEYSSTQRLVVVGELQQPKPPVATKVKPHAYHIANAQTASLDWSLFPVVVLETGVLLLLGLSNRRFSAWYGGAARWLILVPLWGVALYALFGTLSAFLPSSL
ncbi:MAG: class E sortase [Acidimicrobiales bacterium]|jgi:sortase A